MANSVENLYTGHLGVTKVGTANSNLDGSGAIVTVLTGGSNGTFVKTLIIKAQVRTQEGMIRVFVKKSGGSFILVDEYYVPPVTPSSTALSYYKVINLNYALESREELGVSTQQSDTFTIVAEAFDISFSATASFLGSTIEYTPNSGQAVISTANPNLDGTGTITQVFTAGSSGSGFLGCMINSIIIKAQQATSEGMVRLFFDDPATGQKYLFAEVLIPRFAQSGSLQSFGYQVIGAGTLCVPPDTTIWASTENAEAFSVVIDGMDWIYV